MMPDDKEKFHSVCAAMKTLGLNQSLTSSINCLVAAILHIGEVTFAGQG